MSDKIIEPFIDIPNTESLSSSQSSPQDININSMQIGAGNKAMKADQSGLWLGADKFVDAPFSVDMDGNIIANSIKLANLNSIASALSLNQQFTSGTPSDVSGASITITLERLTIMLILVTTNGYAYEVSGTGDWGGNGIVRLLIDGAEADGKSRAVYSGGKSGGDTQGTTGLSSGNIHYIASLAAGTHIIKLTGACDQTGGNAGFNLYNYRLSALAIGNA